MFRGTSQFDKLLEKSTSNLLLEPDWTSILQLCDCVRQGDVQPKYAVNAIKKKIHSPNPHVALYALQVMESCVKNCGASIHQEVATKPFMEEIRELVKACTNDSVKNKILELIQAWAYAFRNEPNYRAIQDTVTVMKMEGNTFPTLKESDAMFMADRAPDWADGEVCHRCRVQFSMVQRKHHCRNCGQIFCGKCSSKQSTIPKFGIEKEVRVCEACHDRLNKHTHPKVVDGDLPPEYLTSSLAMQPQVNKDGPPNKSEQEIQEEEDLQLALALSKSDAENKEKEKMRVTQNLLSGVGGTPSQQTYAPSSTSSAPPALDSNLEMDPELAKYLNRSYWEQKQQQEDSSKTMATTIPSAPASSSTSTFSNFTAVKVSEKYQNGETDELDGFVAALRSNIEIFVNRMKSNSSRGRSIANDTAVQGLFMNITAMHSQLLKFSQEQEDSRVRYEGLQDKLNQIKDARAALDALREDHRERLRREAEEAERQRQIQMAYKLEIMRKKKQEYLEYQRQIAMQRMQEQEREMQLRQEQQKQQYMRGLPPGVYVPPQGPYMPPPPPQGTNDGSPVHNPYPPQQSHYPQSLPQPQSFQPPPDFHPPYSMPGMGPGMPPVTQPMYGQGQMVPPPGSIPSQQPPPPQLTQNAGPSQQPQHAIPNSGPPSLPPNTSNSYHQPITSVPAGPVPNMLPGNSNQAPNAMMGPPTPSHPSAEQHVPAPPQEAQLISFD